MNKMIIDFPFSEHTKHSFIFDENWVMYDFSPEFGQCSHVQFGVFDGGVLCFIQNKAESFILRRNFVKKQERNLLVSL